MNRRFTRLIALILLLVMGLSSCVDKTPKDPTPSDTPGDSTGDGAQGVLFGGSNDYRVVYPATASTDVRNLVSTFKGEIKAKTGKNPSFVTDSESLKNENEREILLGFTNRKEGASIQDTLPEKGYRIEFVGKRLFIMATDDMMLEKAVERFLSELKLSNKTLSINTGIKITFDDSKAVYPLTENKEFVFNIVIPESASQTLKDAVNNFATQMKTAVGSTNAITVINDSQSPVKDYEISVGFTDREETLEAFSKLSSDYEYRITISGKRIIVAARTDVMLQKALNALSADLRDIFSKEKENATLYYYYEKIEQGDLNFPGLNNTGTLKGQFDIGNEAYVLYTEGVTKQAYDDYLTFLDEKGYTTVETYTLGSGADANSYALLKTSVFSVYCSYLTKANAMRVYVGRSSEAYPEKAVPEPTQKICTPAIWQLEIDTKTSKANAGMSYVIQLEDGTYIVIDGGYKNSSDAQRLYDLLLANKPASHEKPIIAAWFLTHLHVDHWGCFATFCDSGYASKVEVKSFCYNLPFVEIGSNKNSGDYLWPDNARNIENRMKNSFPNAVRYEKLHSGMTFGFAGAEVTMLCTLEDVYPLKFNSGNETSITFMITVKGQKLLFLADAEKSQSTVMEQTLPASALKCDILQFSHHGYEGCLQSLYEIANPSVVFWPMNGAGWQGKSSYKDEPSNVLAEWVTKTYGQYAMANKYIWESESVKEIIFSGAGTRKLILPYAIPETWSRPNLNDIYNKQKQEQQEK